MQVAALRAYEIEMKVTRYYPNTKTALLMSFAQKNKQTNKLELLGLSLGMGFFHVLCSQFSNWESH